MKLCNTTASKWVPETDTVGVRDKTRTRGSKGSLPLWAEMSHLLPPLSFSHCYIKCIFLLYLSFSSLQYVFYLDVVAQHIELNLVENVLILLVHVFLCNSGITKNKSCKRWFHFSSQH